LRCYNISIMPFAATTWGPDSESFYVGARACPAGVAAAWYAVHARMAGDDRAAQWYAQLAMDSDAFAKAERAAGRTAHRGNIVGNAWSYFYECITGCPSGW
jgi:hypothetical protein